MSFVDGIICASCNKKYNYQKAINLCQCGSPLLVHYDLLKAREELSRDRITARKEKSMWRYHELLPVLEKENIISLGEGYTPLIPLTRLGPRLGLKNLLVKDEGLNPTGTFKARGAAVGVSKIKELGIGDICMPTAGNAGGAWSLYSARAGINIHVAMPKDAPILAQKESFMAGADIYLVDGLISDAGKIIAHGGKRYGWFEVSTLKEPYRIEGKKTMGYEIAEQLDWEMPDVILYPTGGGVGLIGIWKALEEMEELGWIPKGKRPRMVAVQSNGCAPILQAFQERSKTSKFFPDAKTIAGGIRVPHALGDFLILEALYQSGGVAIGVSDAEILTAMKEIAFFEGLGICPEGAACVAALTALKESGFLSPYDRIIIINTGTSLKYPEMIEIDLPILQIHERI